MWHRRGKEWCALDVFSFSVFVEMTIRDFWGSFQKISSHGRIARGLASRFGRWSDVRWLIKPSTGFSDKNGFQFCIANSSAVDR
jgi:hypothetical protein